MPGPQKTSKPSSQLQKKPKAIGCVRSGLTSDDVKAVPFMWRKRIRVICTDPDATESSSDEDERVFPKRLVREILIPANCSFPFSENEDDLDKPRIFTGRSCLHSQSSIKSSWPGGALQHKAFGWKRSSAKKLPKSSKSKGLSQSRKFSKFLRQRRQGKWAVKIRESVKGLQLWFHTYGTSETAANADDRFSKKIRGPHLDSVSFTRNLHVHNDIPPHQEYSFDLSGAGLLENDRSSKSLSPIFVNPGLDDCESPGVYATDKISSDTLSNEGPADPGSSEDMPAGGKSYSFTCFNVAFQPFVKLEGVNECSSMASPLLLEEAPFHGELSHIFDVDTADSSRSRSLDSVEDEYFAGGEDLCDMNFDLDTDALTWINVSEIPGT